MIKRILLLAVLVLMATMPVSAYTQTENQYNGGLNASTVLLIHPTGENASTVVTDASFSSKTSTSYGAVSLINTTYRYGNYSLITSKNGTPLYFPGLGMSNVSFADSPDWNFGSGKFTIDWDQYIPTGVSTSGYLYYQTQATASASNRFRIQPRSTTGKIEVFATSGGVMVCNIETTNAVIQTGRWQHIAIQGEGATNSFEIFVDGVNVPLTVSTPLAPLPDYTGPIRIGAGENAGWNGYVSEFRITKGLMLYPLSSGPDVRTAPYTAWNDTTISGLYFKSIPKTVTYNVPFNYTLYARNVSNVSYVNVNLTFPTHLLRADSVYFNDTQFNTLVAVVNNASTTGFVNVNITNQTWLGNLSSVNPGVFDVQFTYINSTSFGPANVSIAATSFWNGNYSGVNSGNFYFRDNTNGDVIPSAIPPIANFSANVTAGVKPVTVQFNDTSTNGPVTTWLWQFGDGSTSTTKNATYTYAVAGIYNVNLTATNAVGSNIKEGTITVYNTAPDSLVADFSASPLAPTVSQSVAFTDTSTDSPNTWNWSFGDGINSTLQNPSHAYSSIGYKNVTLTVTNATGASNTTTKYYYINVNTTGSGINEQDIEMDPLYTLTLRFTDSTTNTAIPTVTVTTSDGQTNTSVNGVVTFFEPYSTVVVYASATGYNGVSSSYVMDSDREETLQMTPAVTNSLNTWWTPHTVQVTVLDANYGNRLYDVNIRAHYNESSMPQEWLNDLYGIGQSPAGDMVNASLIMNGTTGSEGTITFTMLGSLKYDFTLNAAQYGVSDYKVMAFPSDNMFNIYVNTIGSQLPTQKNSSYVSMNGTRVYFTEPDINNVSMCVDYKDTSGQTTSVSVIWKYSNNNTVFNTSTFSPGTSLYTVCNVSRNIRGAQFWWGYNATRNVV